MGLCAAFNVSVYIEWLKNPAYSFSLFWNLMLFIYFGCHTFHYVVYWKITAKAGYTDSQLSDSMDSFQEMYSYRASGVIDRVVIYVVVVLLFIFVYLYLYPLFMLTLQFSNFQSDYINTMPLPQCCIEWYTKKMKTAFDGAVTEKKARNMIVREERQKQDKAERQTQ